MEIKVKKHFIGFRWDTSAPPFHFFLYRNLKQEKNSFTLYPITTSNQITIELTDKKICVGHRINKEQYYFCSNSIEDPKSKRCYYCEMKDFQRCFLFCDGTKSFGNCSNKAAYEYCRNNTCYVYLALVANHVKVGVSFNPLNRWLNQGADLASTIFQAKDGFEARVIEKNISSEFSITQSIRVKTKMQVLNHNYQNDKDLYENLLGAVKKYIANQRYKGNQIVEDKVCDLSNYYGRIPNLKISPIINDIRRSKIITGKIMGMKGSLLVTKNKNSVYVTNVKDISAHVIKLSNEETSMVGQRSLSDFFNSLGTE